MATENMRAAISLGFKSDEFSQVFANEISKGDKRPLDAFEEKLAECLSKNLLDEQNINLAKSPEIIVHPIYNKDRCAALNALAQTGYETWYSELKFSTKNDFVFDDFEITTNGFSLQGINYGPAGVIYHRLWSKQLKTQTNHILRLNHIIVSQDIFVLTAEKLRSMQPPEQPYLANPKPGPRSGGFEHGIEGFNFVAFDHMVTGERHYCSCSIPAHEHMLAETSQLEGYAKNAWPRQVEQLLGKGIYKDGVCHLCIAKHEGAEAASDYYSGELNDFVMPYTDQLMRSQVVDRVTARSEVQQLLGLSRWAREAEMFSIVKRLFPHAKVLREASPEWLGRLRLDVYLPELKLALEHQGEQHYQPIGAFGGQNAFERTIERDMKKKELCAAQSVHLIEIKYDEPLTLKYLRRKLRRFIVKH